MASTSEDFEQKRSLLAAIINSCDDAIVSKTLDGIITTWNPAAERMFGYSAAEVIGQSITIIFPPDRLGEERMLLTSIGRGEVVYHYETIRIRKDGSTVDVSVTLSPIIYSNGSIVGASKIAQGITERRHLQQIIHESQKQLTTFIRRAPISMAMLDKHMTYLAASDRWIMDYGQGLADLTGRNHYEMNPDLPEEWKRFHQEALAGATLKNDEDLWIKGDGSKHWLRWAIVPWTDGNGVVGGIIISTEDVTEQMLTLEDLKVAKAEAEKASDAKSRFLAAASHDLRQPLQALSLQVGILGRKFKLDDQPLVKKMEQCVFSLNAMLSDLLDLSKLDAGAVAPKIEDFSVAEMLTAIIAIHSSAAEAKGIRLRMVNSGLIARTDRLLLERILGNLLSNALRYTDKGGVIIGCRRIQGKVWIEVRDTGIGIPQDNTAEIFDEFKQLANPERNREKGSGLGLAIVKRTADLLGLEVRVSSRLGRGSSFSIELPLGDAARITPAPPSVQEDKEQKLRIALVEDDASLRQTLAYVLEEIGHQVVAAPSSQVVLAGLGETPPDILIADYRLGGMETGIDTIAVLTNAFGVPIPTVILTGETAPDVIRKIADQGVRVHHKPVKLEALTASIRELTMASSK